MVKKELQITKLAHAETRKAQAQLDSIREQTERMHPDKKLEERPDGLWLVWEEDDAPPSPAPPPSPPPEPEPTSEPEPAAEPSESSEPTSRKKKKRRRRTENRSTTETAGDVLGLTPSDEE